MLPRTAPPSSGFAVCWIGRDLDRLPTDYDDPGGAWSRLLAQAVPVRCFPGEP